MSSLIRPIRICRPRRHQAKPLYLVPARLPRLRHSRLRWYRALAELIGGVALVIAAALIWVVKPWL